MSKFEIRRDRALALLECGYLTQSEAAELLGVSRQRVHQWVTAAKLRPILARARHLRKLLSDESSRVQL